MTCPTLTASHQTNDGRSRTRCEAQARTRCVHAMRPFGLRTRDAGLHADGAAVVGPPRRMVSRVAPASAQERQSHGRRPLPCVAIAVISLSCVYASISTSSGRSGTLESATLRKVCRRSAMSPSPRRERQWRPRGGRRVAATTSSRRTARLAPTRGSDHARTAAPGPRPRPDGHAPTQAPAPLPAGRTRPSARA